MPPSAAPRRDWLDALVAALIVASLGLVALLQHSPFATGLTAGALLMVAQGWRTNDQQLIAVAALMPLFGIVAWGVNYGVILLTPHTVDATLARLDAGVSVAIWHWCFSHRLIWQALSLGYNSMGFLGAIAICAAKDRNEYTEYMKGSLMRRQLLIACVLAPFLAAIGYLLCPAVGPGWIRDPHAARNCMPSMHFSWALLFWWYSRGRVRTLMAVYAWVTVVATLGLGQHYWIDLVAAVPFTAAVIWLVSRLDALWWLRGQERSGSREEATGSASQYRDRASADY